MYIEDCIFAIATQNPISISVEKLPLERSYSDLRVRFCLPLLTTFFLALLLCMQFDSQRSQRDVNCDAPRHKHTVYALRTVMHIFMIRSRHVDLDTDRSHRQQHAR